MGTCMNTQLTTHQEKQLEAQINVYPNMQIRKKINAESSRFNKVLYSKVDKNKLEFILSLKPYHDIEPEEAISVEIEVRQSDQFSYLLNKSYEWKIEEDLVKDVNQDNVIFTRVYDKSTSERYSLKIVNFDEYDDYNFKQSLYQLAIMKKLLLAHKGQPHPNIIQLKDAYIILNQQRAHNNKSLVIVQEYFDATLNDIILFRQQHKWGFTEQELCAFLRDMASAMAFLQSVGVSHRDIRPCNIWYLGAQKTYKIGGFDESKIFDSLQQKKKGMQMNNNQYFSEGSEDLNTVRGVPQYLSPEILNILQVNSVQKVLLYDPYKLDIYAMGLTLMMMKNMQNQVDYDTLQNKIKLKTGDVDVDMGSWNLNVLVRRMVTQVKQDRISANELLKICEDKFPYEDYPKVNESNLITSLKYKKKKETDEQYLKDQELVAQQYFNLFDINNWLYKNEEILAYFDNYSDDVYKAQILTQIGEGFLIEQDLSRSKEYFLKACVIYNDLGHKLQGQVQLEGAAKYYELAIDCQRKATNGEDTLELGLLLENIGNVYREMGNLENAQAYEEEALRIIVKERGEQSHESARILNNLGNVYVSQGKYKKAEKRLKRALKISDTLYLNEEQQGQLKAMCLCNLGEVQRLKGNLDKAKRCLEEALQIREQVFGSGHIDIAANVENLGNVYFDLGDFNRAKKEYERALVIKKSKLSADSPEIALTLNNIGNVCKNLGEIDKALKYYEDCIFILHQKHGQDSQHPLIANCLGNMGLIYIDIGDQQRARTELEQCLLILKNTVGQGHPDYEFFLNHYNALPLN